VAAADSTTGKDQDPCGSAASASQMGRFETRWLNRPENLAALADLPSRWIEKVHQRRPPRTIVLDMDSSESPTYGEQEGSAYNGHFGCTCYHPLFVFNQLGDVERCDLRPGNLHSADGWRAVLEPAIVRYRGIVKRLDFRDDAAFANPEIYEFLETEGIGNRIRVSANHVLQGRIGHLHKRPVARPPHEVRRFYASFGYQAQSWKKPRGSSKGRVASRGALSSRRLLSSPTWHGRAMDQERQGRDQMTLLAMPHLRRQRCTSATARVGLQPWQLHASMAWSKAAEPWSLTSLRDKADQDRR
jgi:Transposase DDE domain group 1